jgi:poly(3-hydroxybutyrate) depolymerase
MDGIKKIFYGPNRKGLFVIFLIIAGQGHEWPGGQRLLPKTLSGNNVYTFHATDAIWSFFSTQVLQ